MTLSITKPTVGGSEDTWGTTINTALDDIVTEVNAINSFPSGGIIMWSGTVANVPSGWNLCDGTNGTPNLVDRFIVGSKTDSGATHDIGDTGGANSVTLAADNIPSHTHSFSATTGGAGGHDHTGTTSNAGAHTHTLDGVGFYEATSNTPASVNTSRKGNAISTNSAGAHSHTFTTSTVSDHTHSVSGTTGAYGSGNAFDNRPAYYALAFIMKT